MTRNPIWENEEHNHTVWELIVYLEGQGINRIGKQDCPFSKGTAFLIPPGLSHRETGTKGYRDIFIQIRDLNWGRTHEASLFHDSQGRLLTLSQYLFEEFHGNSSGRRRLINAFWEAIYQILQETDERKELPAAVDWAICLILQNVTNTDFQLSLELEKTGFCGDYFRRLFQKSMGMTPNAYLRNLRLSYAKKLIENTGAVPLRIREIAWASGFADPHYFSRVFHQETGLSPREYRFQRFAAERKHSDAGSFRPADRG